MAVSRTVRATGAARWPKRSASDEPAMLSRFEALVDELAVAPFELTPRRFGLVTACDGGLIEVSGLSVPVGALCSIDDGKGRVLTAEAIGFRNGRTMMMLLGDAVLLRPGARVRAEGRPGMLP